MSKNTNLSFLTDYITADITNGRIGINNASPTVAFDVTGVAKFSSSGTFSGLVSGGNSSPSTSYNAGSWFTGDGLVAGNISSVCGIQINSSTTSTLSAIRFGDGDGANNLYDQGFINYKHTTDSMVFGTNRSTAMTITSAGNVGIGTTSPSVNSNQTSLTINGTNNSRLDMQVSGTRNAGFVAASDAAYLETTAANPLVFITNSTERMRITPSFPTVLLGTSTNTYGQSDRATIELNGSATSLVGFFTAGTAVGYIYNTGSNILGQLNSGGAWQFKSSGGGVQLTFNSTAWASISDERLKNINSYIDNAVDKLNTLRTVNYSWKSDNTNQGYLGLIAQDVYKVFPEVIEKNKKAKTIGEIEDETEYLNVKYTELIPVLIRAIQELSAEITILKNK